MTQTPQEILETYCTEVLLNRKKNLILSFYHLLCDLPALYNIKVIVFLHQSDQVYQNYYYLIILSCNNRHTEKHLIKIPFIIIRSSKSNAH